MLFLLPYLAGVPSLAMEGPSAHVRGMWDNMISWIKSAADYIAVEAASPSNTPVPDINAPSPSNKVECMPMV